MVISLLKALNFLDDTGKPVQRYYDYLDDSQSKTVLADGIKEAYAELFAINVNANELSKQEIVGKLKTLSQGQYKIGVLNHMASTFISLVSLADFSKKKIKSKPVIPESKPIKKTFETPIIPKDQSLEPQDSSFPSLVYNIQIVLPESRDSAVYDAIFRSLKEHLQ
ncbi:MAG: DUF5343 domain-containing protein [candidate division Zixibacteria bacterium]|nr:DUF5343 domain-containing protein [candidate division Zixibacteria bacterium]